MAIFEGLTAVEFASLVVAGITAAVGLYIGYQAYRGLRRNDSEPMRYLSIGLVLLFGVTYVAAFAGNTLLRLGPFSLVYQDYFRLVVRLIQLGGVASIAYSLYLTGRDSAVASGATEGGD